MGGLVSSPSRAERSELDQKQNKAKHARISDSVADIDSPESAASRARAAAMARQAQAQQSQGPSRPSSSEAQAAAQLCLSQQGPITQHPQGIVFRSTRNGEINLSLHNLVECPEFVFNIPGLRRLCLDCNFIDTIPDRIGELSELEDLSLSDNKMTRLPYGVSRLSSLVHLNVSINDVQELSRDMLVPLTKLETLQVEANKLRRIPPVGHLANLKALSAGYNPLEDTPDSVGPLPVSLNHVYIPSAGLSTVPRAVFTCTNLSELNLSENKIVELPKELLTLGMRLEHLYLSCNRLRTLVDGFGDTMIALKRLDLSFNDLEEFPSEIGALPNLRYLCVTGNPFCEGGAAARLAPPKSDDQVSALQQKLGFVMTSNIHILADYPTPDVILPNVYLGEVQTARNKHALKSLGVTNILCVASYLPLYPEIFNYMVVDIDDTDESDLLSQLPRCIQFISEALAKNGAILIHCHAGVSRSATVTIAYVMNTLRLTAAKAIEYVQQRRPRICPKKGFLQQLQLWERQLSIENAADCAQGGNTWPQDSERAHRSNRQAPDNAAEFVLGGSTL
eukprot:m51a1_g3349 putative leucine rich repeat protein (564) ;mRNA; f:409686-411648